MIPPLSRRSCAPGSSTPKEMSSASTPPSRHVSRTRCALAGVFGSNAEGRFVYEQQAYVREDDGQVVWLRVMCSGPRPAERMSRAQRSVGGAPCDREVVECDNRERFLKRWLENPSHARSTAREDAVRHPAPQPGSRSPQPRRPHAGSRGLAVSRVHRPGMRLKAYASRNLTDPTPGFGRPFALARRAGKPLYVQPEKLALRAHLRPRRSGRRGRARARYDDPRLGAPRGAAHLCRIGAGIEIWPLAHACSRAHEQHAGEAHHLRQRPHLQEFRARAGASRINSGLRS